MSYKLTCPSCDRYLSSIFLAYEEGLPCPCCGASLHAASEQFYRQLPDDHRYSHPQPRRPEVKCPECVKEGQSSKVYSRGGTKTLLGGGGSFWDEDGERHSHDPNTVTSYYRCSNGHEWGTKSRIPCPNENCDYGKGEHL